jgi:hypothetical protein
LYSLENVNFSYFLANLSTEISDYKLFNLITALISIIIIIILIYINPEFSIRLMDADSIIFNLTPLEVKSQFAMELSTLTYDINHTFSELHINNLNFESYFYKLEAFRALNKTQEELHYRILAREERLALIRNFNHLRANISLRTSLVLQAKYKFPSASFGRFEYISGIDQVTLNISTNLATNPAWNV